MPENMKFLVCVNEKDHSRTALRYACIKAKWRKCAVEMLYVVDPLDYNTIFSVGDKIKKDRKEAAEELFEKLAIEAEQWSGVKPSGIVREGKIADVIVNTIEEDEDISLLVLGVAADGSSGKGGLMPQLTNAVGDKYHVPILIVPGNLTDEEIEKLN